MIIYFFLALSSVILLALRNTSFYFQQILRVIIEVITIGTLFLLYVFRSIDVGSDYRMYYGLFFKTPNFLRTIPIENGYIWLNQFAYQINNFRFIAIAVFIIIVLGILFLGKQYEQNQFSILAFFILTYTFCSAFNVSRQFIAIGISAIGFSILISSKKLLQVRIILFALFIVLASQFHKSALFCLLVPFLGLIKPKKKIVLGAGIVTLILFFSGIGIKLMNSVASGNGYYMNKYATQAASLITTGNKGFLQMLPVIIQFIFLYVALEKSKIKSYKNRLLWNSYLLYLFFYAAGGTVTADRLQLYFLPFVIVGNSKYLLISDQDKSFLFKWTIVVFWMVYFILRILQNTAMVVPYQFSF